MINEIPTCLNNFECFEEGDRLLGLADATLPEINLITAELSGAGLAGKLDYPVKGNFESMELGLTWRAVFNQPLKLIRPGGTMLSLRGAVEGYEAATGTIKITPLRVDCRVLSKGINLGKFEAAAQMETESTYTIDYLKIVVDDRTVVEIDFFNYVFTVDGVDYMSDVRRAVGLS